MVHFQIKYRILQKAKLSYYIVFLGLLYSTGVCREEITRTMGLKEEDGSTQDESEAAGSEKEEVLSYNQGAGKVTGIIQFLCGVVSCSCGVVIMLVIFDVLDNSFDADDDSYGIVAYPVWAGVVSIPCSPM